MFKIGFTGTRHGMTESQKNEFRNLISQIEFQEFHHGMCIGSDAEAHSIVSSLKKNTSIKIVGHPPTYKEFMSNCDCDLLIRAEPYLQRNHNIVDSTDILIATPDTMEKTQSGTWSTIRYARKKNKKIYIIHKNGRNTIDERK